jgi:ketosteroid isomerase-like protein
MSARSQIENATYRYAWAFDENDMELLADCFAEDAELVEPSGNRIVGRGPIREAFAKRRADRLERGEQPRHFTTNVFVHSQSGSTAEASSYFVMHTTKDGALVGTSVGSYLDTWVDDGGTWRLKRRVMRGEGRS